MTDDQKIRAILTAPDLVQTPQPLDEGDPRVKQVLCASPSLGQVAENHNYANEWGHAKAYDVNITYALISYTGPEE